LLIAQLTDFHLRPPGLLVSNQVDTNAMAAAAIDSVLRLSPQPDCLLISGDLTDCGLPEEYDALRSHLQRLSMPIYCIPGNHDRRENFRKALADMTGPDPVDEFIQFVSDLGPLRLIALDTVVPDEGFGDLCDRQLAWLGNALEESGDRPVLIMMHHPPGRTGIQFMDQIGLRASSLMAPIIARHARIERIICGHVHRTIHYRWAGSTVSIAPGVAHHVTLELDGGPAGFTLEPPGFHLHLWDADQGLVTHQVPIGPAFVSHTFAHNPDYPGKGSALADQDHLVAVARRARGHEARLCVTDLADSP
jgi:3',5'-cyclic AMP phosphodiesterase CpdA